MKCKGCGKTIRPGTTFCNEKCHVQFIKHKSVNSEQPVNLTENERLWICAIMNYDLGILQIAKRRKFHPISGFVYHPMHDEFAKRDKKIIKKLGGIVNIKPALYANIRCGSCMGYGLHALGAPTPMGPLDHADGMPTRKCPECGAG